MGVSLECMVRMLGTEFDPTEAELRSFGGNIEERNSKGGSSDSEPHPSEGETTDAETDGYTCGVNGCSRTVDGPNETCWQHSD